MLKIVPDLGCGNRKNGCAQCCGRKNRRKIIIWNKIHKLSYD